VGEPSVEERIAASIAAYDAHAREHKARHRGSRPTADIRRFAQLADDGALVLDVACGPASDMRQLRDAGLKPVGVDLSWGALEEARLLLPKDPLVRAPFDDLPFRIRSFRGLWLNDAFAHLPRAAWRENFARLLNYLEAGPVYFACVRGDADLEPWEDPVLGVVYRSSAHEREIEALLTSHGLLDVQVELRPDPFLDRKRPWVVGLGRTPAGG
jgi:hypothetical protein